MKKGATPKDPTSKDGEARRARGDDKPGRPAKTARLQRSPALALSISLVALLGLYTGALTFLRPPSPGTALTLDTFTRDATCGIPVFVSSPADPALDGYCRTASRRILTARLLDEDARIVGTFVPGSPRKAGGNQGRPQKFWTSYPRSDAGTGDLLKSLYASNATVRVEPQTAKGVVRFVAQFLLPLVVLANLFALLFAAGPAGGNSGIAEFLSFGRVSGKRQVKRPGSDATFADVAAADEAVLELAEVRDYLADPTAFAAMGALPPKGVLLMGPPGCGKTLLARAVAGEARASFFSMSGSEFVESLVGVGAARVRDLFAQARANSPAILFIDELDAVGRRRGAGIGQGHDEREQTLNEMLVQMDGFSASEGVVVMGATNRPDILDPALLRAGRFDRHVTLDRPDRQGRLEILRLHARGRRLAEPDADLAEVARLTPGFTGADLANVLNEAALLAVRERATAVSRAHLEEAVDRVLSGPRRRGQLISAAEKGRISHHEAGHALVAAALGQAGAVHKVSIIARGRGLGHLATLGDERATLTRDELAARIAVAMAGFVAEELVYGQPSTGAESDLERATHLARDMAGRYGMSRLGPVRILGQDQEVFLGRDYLQARDVSQPTLEHLDAEVLRIVEEQKQAAHDVLSANRPALAALADALAARETVQGPELDQLLSATAAGAGAAANGGRRPARATRARTRA